MNERIEALAKRIEEVEFELMSEKIVRSSTEQGISDVHIKMDHVNERIDRLERFVLMQADYIRELQNKLGERN